MGVIYIATNTVNGKKYIGQTIYTMEHRKYAHRRDALNKGSNLLFHKAIRKYGFDVFRWETIVSGLDQDNLDYHEIRFIAKYKTRDPNGYNLTDGGNGTLGRKGNKLSEEHKNKISNGNKGKVRSKETRDKLRAISKTNVTREHIERLRAINTGRKHTEEAKARIGAASRGNKYGLGKKHTQEAKNKIGAASKGNKYCLGKTPSEYTRMRASQTHKGRKQSPELVARRLETRRMNREKKKADKKNECKKSKNNCGFGII